MAKTDNLQYKDLKTWWSQISDNWIMVEQALTKAKDYKKFTDHKWSDT